MARADIATLLPLDEYASIMAIHPDNFNQCVFEDEQPPATCRVWQQYGYFDQRTGRIVGRHDVAQAIATAEWKIAEALGFYPIPTWIKADEIQWPQPARGCQVAFPPLLASWGWILAPGKRELTAISAGAAPVYSAPVVGGGRDTATITIAAALMTAAGASREEVAVYFAGETDETYRIHYLDITEDGAGNVTIVGRRSQFVDPALWGAPDEIDLDTIGNFVATVDVYRRWTDPDESAQIVWLGGPASCSSTPFCGQTCQDSCINIMDTRLGKVYVMPGTYAAGTGLWTSASLSVNRIPDKANLWYYAGYPLMDNLRAKPEIAEAIVRLANCYLPASPCGCQQTESRWKRDNEMMSINDLDTARAMSAFGTTCRGAIFAWSVVKRMEPITGGDAL